MKSEDPRNVNGLKIESRSHTQSRTRRSLITSRQRPVNQISVSKEIVTRG